MNPYEVNKRQHLTQLTQASLVTDDKGGRASTAHARSAGLSLWAGIRTGLLSTVLPSLCCVVPAVVMAAGLGALSGLTQLSVLQPYTVAASLVLMAVLSWQTIRRYRACCAGPRQRLLLYLTPGLSLVVFAGVYGGLLYVVVPFLYGAMPDMPGM